MTRSISQPCEKAPTPEAMAQAAAIGAALPVLTTERLTLRAPNLSDFEAYATIVCGPRGVGLGGPMPRDDAWYDFASMVGNWLLRGHGLWSVEETASRTHLGFVVIGFEPGDPHHELGYMFNDTAEGKGFAAEAARAARDYAQSTLNVPVLDSYISAGNHRSIALAKRLGAQYVGDISDPEDDAPSCIYRYPNPAEA
ncbi:MULTISPECIES: GNAT family N-acetyltransferase [unclassified Roseovarius]|uniref:GNAT family N-acetyltransferase n=1 Tax=unclassified Roseovarius TaxID=2614913 RepID=UPI002740019B|nr:GNAT family N-acetyltransferase [Roseovarius sp. MMSF_3350]